MGSKHGAEISELVGLYILQGLKEIIPQHIVGIYRDDGLIAMKKGTSNGEVDKIKKEMHKFAKSMEIKFVIENPSFEINYLDLNLNLKKHSHYPYRKPNNKINYVNASSNHPPAILKQIPKMIENRLSKNSSNAKLFNSIKKEYNDALKLNGYSYEITYANENKNTNNRKRKRKLIWFNPPYCRSVSTNIGKKFLQIIKKHFNKERSISKYVNKNCIKLSYSCMPNVEMIIKNHNRKLINNNKIETLEESCNCRNKNTCPLKGGNCRTQSVIYEATVRTKNDTKKYIGLTANQIKKRIATHKTTINCKPENKNYDQYVNSTEFSKLIHKLKQEKTDYDLSWKILLKENKPRPGKNTCRLCLKEALLILQADKNCINKKIRTNGNVQTQE